MRAQRTTGKLLMPDRITEVATFVSRSWIFCEKSSAVSQTSCARSFTHERAVEAPSLRSSAQLLQEFSSKALSSLVPGLTESSDPCPGEQQGPSASDHAAGAACAIAGRTGRRCHPEHWTRPYHGCRLSPTCRACPTYESRRVGFYSPAGYCVLTESQADRRKPKP